jgi:hypothetical protein
MLDPGDDADWTKAGMPDMDRMKAMTGVADLTRATVTDAAPSFNRDAAKAGDVPSEEDQADGGGDLPAPTSVGRNMSPEDLADKVPDPFLLIEAFVVASLREPYRGNARLGDVMRAYQFNQGEAREVQRRIDFRVRHRQEQEAARAALEGGDDD